MVLRPLSTVFELYRGSQFNRWKESVPGQGRIQDFKIGGAYLKKLRRAEGGGKIVEVFRVKNHDFTPKNHIISNFRGERGAGCAPWIRPCWRYL